MAKRRKLKKGVKSTIITLVILIIIVFGCYFTLTKTEFGKSFLNKAEDVKNKVTEKVTPPKETWPKVSKASLVATGDGLLHNAVYLDAYNKETDTFDFRPQLDMVKDIVSSYDIAYYNQETVFGGRLTNHFNGPNSFLGFDSYPMFNSPSEYGDAMVDAGFNMVSLASNHSADCTSLVKTCVENSYNYWQSKDVVFGGFNPTPEQTNNYIIKEVNGITYTMLSYTTSLNGLDGAVAGQEYLINRYDEEKVKQDILEVRDKVDVLIVAMHWHTGAEYTFEVTPQNREIATFLAEQGVDIVLGTYSHCLQPFEWIDDTLVFYSLGNFISNQGDLVSSIGYKGIVGVLASLDITKTLNEDGSSEIKIDNLGADLTYTYNQNHRNYKVIPFSKMNSNYNSNYLKIYDDYVKVLKGLDENINVKPAGLDT